MKPKAGDDAAPDDPEQDRTDEQPSKAARDNRAAEGNSADDSDRSVLDEQIQRWKDEGGAWLRPD